MQNLLQPPNTDVYREGVAELCCMLSILYLAVPSYSFGHGACHPYILLLMIDFNDD